MSIDHILHISASALEAETRRMGITASNMANAESFDAAGHPYQAKHIIFQAESLDPTGIATSVSAARVITDQNKYIKKYDPHNPYADQEGYVHMPAINQVTEMIDMLDASRAYQANLEVMTTTRDMAMKTIDLLK